ncbi:zinc finger protein 239-like [Ruditapes philippinarum]|uniref:zinc finger protein 239-like n=1 Tax=Ruditapes philippinarum TaxID=129788 RepID=UPI00295B3B23|nr:zinc finger protein 239-like [Ruditapes philippinarum]
MEYVSKSVNMENCKTMSPCLSQDVKTYPFICGICSIKFDDLCLFLRHFRTHGKTSLPNNDIHACSCLYQDAWSEEDSGNNETYKCRSCMKIFFSICKLHSHIVNCSASNGSYILDNSRKMVYPLSLHCSEYEDRGNDTCESTDADNVKLIGKNNNHKAVKVNQKEKKTSPSDNNVNHSDINLHMDELSNGYKSDDKLSHIQHVDHILKYVCKLFEKSEAEKISQVESMDIDLLEKTKIIPKKQVNANFTPENSRTEKVQTRNKKKNFKKANCNKEAENKVQQHEVNSDHVVKTEVEKDNLHEENSDIHNFGKSNAVSVESSKSNTDFLPENDNCNNDADNDNVDIKNDDDDDDDSTDEYTTEDLNVIANLQKGKVRRVTKKSRKHTKIRKQEDHKAEEECSYCGKILKPHRMKKHVISHTEDRPFLCDLCPKSYKYENHLKTHKASHQDVKPYYCEICGKGYETITRLRHHSMINHSDSRPCVCNVCGASFISNYRLNRHMRMHTGEKSVQCDLCGMGFSTRYNLNIHIQGVHKRDRRFTCAECGKTFMTNYQLKVHKMKHTGERPYKCAVCKAEYIERKELRRHLKKQHNMQLEENTNALTTISDVMEGYNTSKVTSTRDTVYSQGTDQTETSTAANYIITDTENLYTYTNTDMCTSAPYYPAIKKLIPPNDYQMIYTNTQEYNYDNSTDELTLPLTVQEIQDSCVVKNLSKHSAEGHV